MVIIPFGHAVLALEDDEFEKALERGQKLIPSAQPNTGEQIVADAKGMEAISKVPASWWLEQARRDKVPSLRYGKYIRFVVREALDAGHER